MWNVFFPELKSIFLPFDVILVVGVVVSFTCCSVIFINVWYFIIIILSLIPPSFYVSNQLNHALNIIFIYYVCKKGEGKGCSVNVWSIDIKEKKSLYVVLIVLDCYHVILCFFSFFYYNLWFMYFWQHELKVQVRYVKWVLIFQCEIC